MTSCLYCLEDIVAGEPQAPVNDGRDRLHAECLIRMVAGSVGHQRRTCSCFGGKDEDPTGLTRREAARAAAELFDQASASAQLKEQ